MNNLGLIHERLHNRFRMLQLQWRQTCEQWDDPVRQKLEREIWRNFEDNIPLALDELRSLSKLIAKAHRELDRKRV